MNGAYCGTQMVFYDSVRVNSPCNHVSSFHLPGSCGGSFGELRSRPFLPFFWRSPAFEGALCWVQH